ncbi:NTP transferase domain-containing protein [Paenibacillus tritici]|uniref:sugar phosphate nucleotidyltransferase n=1 Tax=Paenibacillus tritici TaxID=1873425 RepID=UPI001BA6F415|nr:sugar phosphate nucleotidyltransferase [Paenibacillus tritici]QUL57071.1 NTP transferase domain-containing protein [Paenibacillus tritici]
MKALLLCAGKGKRLQPITKKIPKALVPIGNITLVEHAVMSIRQAGITEIGIVLNDEVSKYRSIIDTMQESAKITYIEQMDPRGTAHAIQISLDFIGDSPFLVYLADNLFGESLKGFVTSFLSNKPMVQIGVKTVLNPKDYGVLELSENNNVLNIEEKPKHPKGDKAVVGVFAFENSCKTLFDDLKLSDRGELEITDALNKAIQQNYNVTAHEFNEWWIDVGNINRLLEANNLYLQDINTKEQRTIATDSIINNSLIIHPVIIGASCNIENSVIGPNVTIGDNTVITGSVVNECVIMSNSKLSGMKEIQDSIVIQKEIVQVRYYQNTREQWQ